VEERYETDLGGLATVCTTIPVGAELIVVIGGDGSIIDASVPAIEYDLPVLGINLGNLGYLAEVEPDNIDDLGRIFTGEYKIEEKMLLSVAIVRENATVESNRLALNDVIISHESYLGLAELSLTDSHGATVKYRADGLILSTPVGSTAYSLSAGGPILSHDIDSILATPICPHSFFNRSVIFNPSEVLTLCNLGTDTLNITVDGRLFAELGERECCVVKTAKKRFRMMTFSDGNMFSTLFGKMKRFENI
jgi:NAD+ kinase